MEVARAHLDRIERLNPKLNAFVDYKPDAVLAQAREAEKALMRAIGLTIKTSLGRCLACLFLSSLRLMWLGIVAKLGRGCGLGMLRLRMLRWWLGCGRLER